MMVFPISFIAKLYCMLIFFLLYLVPEFIVKFLKLDALVSHGCYNKESRVRWIKKTQNKFTVSQY